MLACTPSLPHLTRTPGESVVVVMCRLHHHCIESALTHPPPSPPLAPFIGKAGFMDEGSHGRRMVCKELDVTSTTHELLTHTLLCVTDPALHQHWEYGNFRGPTASIASLWKKILNMEIQPVSLPLPHLLCSTPPLQDLLPALFILAGETSSGKGFSTLL